MCQWDTTGVEYACGHYIITSYDRKNDCGSPYCTKSERHSRSCRSLACIQHYGPDRTQTTARVSDNFCTHCQEGFVNRHRGR
ncbi:hypothetical protein MKEN_00650500 [Mycena kentingensis (nom. inval.)]|nr:hypothetical protein MKEN_00650500 [Mycena kentingensis (nom. inval.)]